jgi:hypothetical protein
MKSNEFYKLTAWKYFSRYVLLFHSQDGITVRCFTSGKELRLNNRECCAGHWIKVFDSSNRTNFATAFEFNNCYPQSNYDNRFLNGRPDKMQMEIIKLHGLKESERLIQLSKRPFKLDKSTLDCIVDEYKLKFNELIKIKGNPWKMINN